MRRGLIPVLILADDFRRPFVMASLDIAFHESLQSALSNKMEQKICRMLSPRPQLTFWNGSPSR